MSARKGKLLALPAPSTAARSAARQALAAAIEWHAATEARLNKLKEAGERQITAEEAAVDQLKALETQEEEQNTRENLLARAMRQTTEALVNVEIRAEERFRADAALNEARKIGAVLVEEISSAQASLQLASEKVAEAVRAVLAEGNAMAIVRKVDELQRDLVKYAAALNWLINTGAIPYQFGYRNPGYEIPTDPLVREVVGRFVNKTIEPKSDDISCLYKIEVDRSVENVWRAAAAALAQYPDAPLPDVA